MPLYCQFDYRSSCRTFTFPFLVSDSVFLVLFRHRRGRKTKTSSDASDEAPERARNDTPKEVKLHEGSILFSRHSGEVSQASIRRFPWPQGRRSRGDRPTVRSRGTRDPTSWSRQARPSLRGKSVCRGDPGHAPFRVGGNSIPKIRPASEIIWQKAVSAQPLSPAGLPGLSQPGVCLVAL